VLWELHEEDPEGGYRVLADDLHDLGYQISERRVWRLCNVAGIGSTIAGRKRKHHKAGPPVGDDLVQRDFTAEVLDRVWLTDITEHRTAWIPAVVATVGVKRRPVKQPAALRVSQSSDFLGLSLSSSATACRSSTVCGAKSCPRGKY
jgi:transposase InsO family protein